MDQAQRPDQEASYRHGLEGNLWPFFRLTIGGVLPTPIHFPMNVGIGQQNDLNLEMLAVALFSSEDYRNTVLVMQNMRRG